MNGYLLACGSEPTIAAALGSGDWSSTARGGSSGSISATSEALLDAYDDASMSVTYSFPGNLPLFTGAIATMLDCSGRVATIMPGEEGPIPTSFGSCFSGSIAGEGSGSAIAGASPAGSTAGIAGSGDLIGGELWPMASVSTVATGSDGSSLKAVGESSLSLRPR